MSGLMSDPKEELYQPEDDGSLQYWMWCEEEEEVLPEEDEWDGQPDEAQEWHDFDPDCWGLGLTGAEKRPAADDVSPLAARVYVNSKKLCKTLQNNCTKALTNADKYSILQ